MATNERSPEIGATETARVLDLIATEQAPRYDNGHVNLRVLCADGFAVSVQASWGHYSINSAGRRPSYKSDAAHPFVSFEVGYPSEDPPADVWDEYEGGGIWAFVPRQVVADLLDLHGGPIGWKDNADV